MATGPTRSRISPPRRPWPAAGRGAAGAWHLPGHGRATADSHLKLPVIDTPRATLEQTDFAAFRPLAGLPLGMTAHVVFSAIDPATPATTSVTMLREVIRGWIGSRDC